MRTRLVLKAFILLLPIPFTSCQLLGGTEVSFINSTAFSIAIIQFGPLVVSGPLAPSSQTRSYTITPGQNVLTAESQGGSWTNAVLLSIVAGHGYTVTFNPGATFSQVTISLAAIN